MNLHALLVLFSILYIVNADFDKSLFPKGPFAFGRPCSDRSYWNPLITPTDVNYWSNAADKILAKNPNTIIDPFNLTLYNQFFINGNRGSDGNMGARAAQLWTLAQAECMTNTGKYKPHIEKALWDVASQPAWTMAANTDFKRPNVPSNNVTSRIPLVSASEMQKICQRVLQKASCSDSDLNTVAIKKVSQGPYAYQVSAEVIEPVNYDMATGPLVYTLSKVIYFLDIHPALVQKVIDITQKRTSYIKRKVLESCRDNSLTFSWLGATTNVNALNNGGFLSASGLIFANDPQGIYDLAVCIRKSLPKYLSSFEEDGFYTEGPCYYGGTMGHVIFIREMFMKWSNNTVDLFDNPKWQKGALYSSEYFMRPSTYMNIGDSKPSQIVDNYVSNYARYVLGFTNTYSSDGIAPEILQNVRVRYPPIKVKNVFVTTKSFNSKRKYYNESKVWTFRPNEQNLEGDFYATLKVGGTNRDKGHYHHDIGSFTINLNGTDIFGDLGTAIYTGSLFSAQRYNHPVVNSYGHPVPLVNKKNQSDAFDVLKKGMPATTYTNDENTDQVTIDLTSAYKDQVREILKVTRDFTYARNAVVSLQELSSYLTGPLLIITDSFESTSPIDFGTALTSYKIFLGKSKAPTVTELKNGKYLFQYANNLAVYVDYTSSTFDVKFNALDITDLDQVFTRYGFDFIQKTTKGTIKIQIQQVKSSQVLNLIRFFQTGGVSPSTTSIAVTTSSSLSKSSSISSTATTSTFSSFTRSSYDSPPSSTTLRDPTSSPTSVPSDDKKDEKKDEKNDRKGKKVCRRIQRKYKRNRILLHK